MVFWLSEIPHTGSSPVQWDSTPYSNGIILYFPPQNKESCPTISFVRCDPFLLLLTPHSSINLIQECTCNFPAFKMGTTQYGRTTIKLSIIYIYIYIYTSSPLITYFLLTFTLSHTHKLLSLSLGHISMASHKHNVQHGFKLRCATVIVGVT